MASLRAPLASIVLSSIPGDRSAAPEVASDLIEACRRGDRGALDTVFRAHAHGVAQLLKRIVGPSADVDDLLQDTFAAAISAFPKFRGEASVRTWLHRIAVHVAHQHLRRPRHRREVELDAAHERGDAGAPSPEERERARRLYEHLDTLDAAKRITLVLYVIEGHSVDEIAALMHASKAATRSRILWARRKLMKRLRRDPMFGGRP